MSALPGHRPVLRERRQVRLLPWGRCLLAALMKPDLDALFDRWWEKPWHDCLACANLELGLRWLHDRAYDHRARPVMMKFVKACPHCGNPEHSSGGCFMPPW